MRSEFNLDRLGKFGKLVGDSYRKSEVDDKLKALRQIKSHILNSTLSW